MEKLDVKEIIRSHGLKATPNRIAVYEYMLNLSLIHILMRDVLI